MYAPLDQGLSNDWMNLLLTYRWAIFKKRGFVSLISLYFCVRALLSVIFSRPPCHLICVFRYARNHQKKVTTHLWNRKKKNPAQAVRAAKSLRFSKKHFRSFCCRRLVSRSMDHSPWFYKLSYYFFEFLLSFHRISREHSKDPNQKFNNEQ